MEPCGTADHCGGKAAAKLSPPHAPVIRSDIRRHRLFGLAKIVGVILCLGLTALSSVCCGPGYPPDMRVVAPQVALDDQGNVVALYQVSDGRGAITYVQKLSPDGDRLWGKKGVRLDEREPDFPGSRDVTTSSYADLMVADGSGNVTVFWIYDGQIYAEKLRSDGSPLWQPERLVVGTFHPPGQRVVTRWTVAANGADATIVWTDENGDLNFQSIDGDGNLLWTAQPFDVSAHQLEARRDQDGNTWLMRADARTGGIYLQVIDKTGKTVWAEARELEHGSPEPLYRYALWLAEDGHGGVVAAWRYGDSGPLEVRSVSIDGEVQVNAADGYFKQNDRATLPGPLIDGKDGLVALWATGDSVLAQRIDSQGSVAWGENGIVVGTNLATLDTGGYDFQGSSQPGGTVVSWEASTAGGTVCRAQLIDTQGHLLWPSGGVTISTAVEGYWRWQWLATTSDGAAVLSGVMSEGGSRRSRIQKVRADGSLPWGTDGVCLDDWRDGG